jgi:heterodisulfide reductase subunit A
VVTPVLCKGDGLCNAKCPSGAISLKHYTDDEIFSQIDAEVPDSLKAEKETAGVSE